MIGADLELVDSKASLLQLRALAAHTLSGIRLQLNLNQVYAPVLSKLKTLAGSWLDHIPGSVLCARSILQLTLLLFTLTQSRALQWMLKRERVSGEIEDPCWKGLVSSGGLPCWVCTATGQFAMDPPPSLQDCKGGLFCDEPVSIYTVKSQQHWQFKGCLGFVGGHAHSGAPLTPLCSPTS